RGGASLACPRSRGAPARCGCLTTCPAKPSPPLKRSRVGGRRPPLRLPPNIWRPFMTPTPKQLNILIAIRDFRVRNGYSPTMQELADQLGVSKVTIFEHIEALEKKELILRARNRPRS